MFTFLGLFFGFLLLGVPIALALGVGGLFYLYFTDNWMLVAALPQRMLSGVDQFILLTIPLFLLAGSLMNFGGLSTRMVNFANGLVVISRADCRWSPCLQASCSPEFRGVPSRSPPPSEAS
jgi:C4-dicarboxylate transporter, DctM subunit